MNTLTTLARYVRAQFVNDLKVSLEIGVQDGILLLKGYKDNHKVTILIFPDKVKVHIGALDFMSGETNEWLFADPEFSSETLTKWVGKYLSNPTSVS